MKIEILGCSGGIGRGLKTTSFLVDDCLLIDAGSGVESLTSEQMLKVRHVLLTHAHLDHIFGLPLMLATIFDQHQVPVQVYALPAVITALRTHIFNGVIWPDFTRIPAARPIVALHEIEIGEPFALNEYGILPLPATHPSPTAGYLVSRQGKSFAFSGDSGINPAFWSLVNRHRPSPVIVDVSFTNRSAELARQSGHLTAEQLGDSLAGLSYYPSVRVTHMKPGYEAEITAQCAALKDVEVSPLRQGECIEMEN